MANPNWIRLCRFHQSVGQEWQALALPTNQPVPEILRRWTVVRGITPDNDAGGRIIRHRIPSRESIADASQELALIEQTIHQVAIRILDDLRSLQVTFRRSRALKKQALTVGDTMQSSRLAKAHFL